MGALTCYCNFKSSFQLFKSAAFVTIVPGGPVIKVFVQAPHSAITLYPFLPLVLLRYYFVTQASNGDNTWSFQHTLHRDGPQLSIGLGNAMQPSLGACM